MAAHVQIQNHVKRYARHRQQIRGGRVLWVNGPHAINSAAFHAIAYPALCNPEAYGKKRR